MINRITAITNEALRERWSTVALLTALLTIGKAHSIRAAYAIDVQGYFAQVFFAIVVSFLLALVIHVLLFIIFSPKKQLTEKLVIIGATPVKTQRDNDAAITAVHSELEAANQAALVMNTQSSKTPKKTFNLAKELGVPAKPAKKATKKSSRAKAKPVKKKAAKKKK